VPDHQTYAMNIDHLLSNICVYRVLDGEIYFEDFNVTAQCTENITKEALIGKKLLDVFPNVKSFGLYDVLLRVYETGESEVFDLKFYEDTRICGWRENYVSKLGDDFVMAVYRDLSHQKKLEFENERIAYVLDVAQEVSKLGAWDWDIQGNTLWWSDQMKELFGYDEIVKNPNSFKDFLRKVHPMDRTHVNAMIRSALYEKQTLSRFDTRILPKEGKELIVSSVAKLFFDAEGNPIRLIGASQDVTRERLAAQQIAILNDALAEQFELEVKEKLEVEKREKEIAKQLELINRYVMISETDLSGNITHVSQAFCDAFGYTKEELMGNNHRMVKSYENDPEIYTSLWESISHDKTWASELKSRTKEGLPFWVQITISPKYDEHARKVGYTAIRQNITAKKMFELFSITDGLTGIFNRRHFDTKLPELINSVKRDKRFLCMLMLDVDYFKRYNDGYGHGAGDEVLKKVAKAIENRFQRSNDSVFRVGGEEFCVLSLSVTPKEFYALAQQLKEDIEALKIDHAYSDVSEFITVSMGANVWSAFENLDSKAMYDDVDAKLYKAKEGGRNRLVCE